MPSSQNSQPKISPTLQRKISSRHIDRKVKNKQSTVIGSGLVGVVLTIIAYYMSHRLPEMTLACNVQEAFGGENLKCGLLTSLFQAYSILYFLAVLSFILCGLVILEKVMKIYQGASLEGFTKAIAEDPNNPENYVKRGSYYLRNKELRKALADFIAASKLDPNNARIINKCGACWQGLHEYDKALTCFKQAMTLKPDNELYRSNLSRLEAIIQRSSTS